MVPLYITIGVQTWTQRNVIKSMAFFLIVIWAILSGIVGYLGYRDQGFSAYLIESILLGFGLIILEIVIGSLGVWFIKKKIGR
jgi:hypothetical protein